MARQLLTVVELDKGTADPPSIVRPIKEFKTQDKEVFSHTSLGARNMVEPGCHEHERRVPIREATDHPGSSWLGRLRWGGMSR